MTDAVSPAASATRAWFQPRPLTLVLIGVAIFLVSLAAFAPGFSEAKDVYFD